MNGIIKRIVVPHIRKHGFTDALSNLTASSHLIGPNKKTHTTVYVDLLTFYIGVTSQYAKELA